MAGSVVQSGNESCGEKPMSAPGTPTATPWRSRRPLLLLALLGLVLAGLLAGQARPAAAGNKPTPASGPPYLADATDPAVTTLAADRHISIQEARRRIGWQEPAMQLGEELRRALGGRYGGLWFDEAGGGRVKVGLVGADRSGAAALIARRQLTAVTDLVAVQHSHADLEQAHAWLSEAIIKANPPAAKGRISGLASALLVDKNQVQLQLPRGQALNAAQQAAVAAAKRRLGPRLAVGSWSGQTHTEECQWGTGLRIWDCDPPLRGGVGIVSFSGTTRSTCTAGFNVRSTSDFKWYVLTAGHCGAKGTTWEGQPPNPPPNSWAVIIGKMHNSVNSPSSYNDYGIIANEGQLSYWNPGPYVYVHPSPDTTPNVQYVIKGVGGSTKDLRVCVSGAVSGTDCAPVKRTGWPVAGGYAVVDYCTTGGDSGGPVFSGNYARGIHVGAMRGATACHDRLYQGVAEATQQLRVSVVHT
jgi:streptogrisin C